MNVIFICTGNICRSAMAHWLLEKMKGNKEIEVYSCGVYARGTEMNQLIMRKK